NVLAAWEWAVQTANVEAIGKSATPLYFYCQMQSRFLEGARALAKAAEVLESRPAGKERDILLGHMYNNEGWLRVRVGHFERAETIHAQSCEMFERHNEPPPPYMGGDSTVALGIIATIKGSQSRAIELGEQALQAAEARDDIINQAFAHYLLTTAKASLGEYEAAYLHGQRACSLARQWGNRWYLAHPLIEWGRVAKAMGKVEEAKKHFHASYTLKKEFDDREGMAVALRHLGEIALLQSDDAEAERLFGESMVLYRQLNDQGGLAASLKGLAQVACKQQAYEEARQNLEQALAIAAEIQFLPLLLALLVDAAGLLLQSDEPAVGLALLALVRDHTAGDEATRAEAGRQLNRWQEEGDETTVTQALAQAEQLDLETAVTTLQTILASPLSVETSTSIAADSLDEPLTDREKEVLSLMAQGYTNPEIAEELIIALGTVKWYASQIYGKLGVSNRTEAVVRGRELGLLS
ncbi:MAG: tetratricopeptide repeat protein, partial [Chloroflexota bacterium]